MSILLQQGRYWVRKDSDKYYAECEAREAKARMNPVWRFIRSFIFSA